MILFRQWWMFSCLIQSVNCTLYLMCAMLSKRKSLHLLTMYYQFQFFLQNLQNSSHGESYERIANGFGLVCCLWRFERTEYFSEFWGNKCCKQSCIIKQYTFYKKNLKIDDYKDGRVSSYRIFQIWKSKMKSAGGLSVAKCVKNFKFNHVLYSMTPKLQTKTVSNAYILYNLLKKEQHNLSRKCKIPWKMVKDGDNPNTLVKLNNFAQQGAVTFSFLYMYVSSAVILNINILVFDQVNYPSMVNVLTRSIISLKLNTSIYLYIWNQNKSYEICFKF